MEQMDELEAAGGEWLSDDLMLILEDYVSRSRRLDQADPDAMVVDDPRDLTRIADVLSRCRLEPGDGLVLSGCVVGND